MHFVPCRAACAWRYAAEAGSRWRISRSRRKRGTGSGFIARIFSAMEVRSLDVYFNVTIRGLLAARSDGFSHWFEVMASAISAGAAKAATTNDGGDKTLCFRGSVV